MDPRNALTFTIRERARGAIDRGDRAGVSAIETAFETRAIYDVAVTPLAIALVERPLAAPRVKRYAIADAFAPWSTWEVAWIAEDATGAICGFAAVEYEQWHARLVLWHLYVAPARRRAGIARALLARVEDRGRALGAERVWLETSNVNVPGIAAYGKLGYALCGVDTTEYDTLDYADETAVYLAKRLG